MRVFPFSLIWYNIFSLIRRYFFVLRIISKEKDRAEKAESWKAKTENS